MTLIQEYAQFCIKKFSINKPNKRTINYQFNGNNFPLETVVSTVIANIPKETVFDRVQELKKEMFDNPSFNEELTSAIEKFVDDKRSGITVKDTVNTLSREELLALVPCVDFKSGNTILWDNTNKRISDLSYKAYKTIMPNTFLTKLKEAGAFKPVFLEYDPYDPSRIAPVQQDYGTVDRINLYEQPEWMNLKPTGGMPEEAKQFFEYFYPNEIDRFQVYYSIKQQLIGRCSYHIYLVAPKGVGKNLMAENTMRALVGNRNFVKAQKSFFKTNFQSVMANKKVVMIDEIKAKTGESKDDLKRMANKIQTIERKNENAEESTEIHASFWICTNGMDDIYIEEDDRRFLIPEVTKDSVNSALGKNFGRKYVRLLENDTQFVSNLGHFFLNLKLPSNYDAENAFITDYFKEVADYCLSEAHNLVIEKIQSGEQDEYTYSQLREEFGILYSNSKVFPKRKKLKTFLENYTIDDKRIAKVTMTNNVMTITPHKE